MSAVKRLVDLQRDIDHKVYSTKLLYQHDYIEHENEIGVCRQIIGRGTTLGLTPKQQYIFNQFIKPKFDKYLTYCRCCLDTIVKEHASKSFRDESGDEKFWCSEQCVKRSFEKGYF